MSLFEMSAIRFLILLLGLSACGDPTGAPVWPPLTAATPARTDTAGATLQPRVEVVATGLEVPWSLAFATRLPVSAGQPRSGSYVLLTERPGRIRLIVDGRLQAEPVAMLPVTATDEGGAMGLALDPDVERNGHLYVMYTTTTGAGLRNRISRLSLRGTRAGDEKILLDGIPAGRLHDGGRLKIGPDGKLYATTGETTRGDLAQRLDSLAGKVLRLNLDGSIPSDNPFSGSPIYSYGHRNPQGLAWQPETGQLFNTEHGPSIERGICCHDEVNRILPGANYGWPVVYGAPGDPRFVDPIHESGTDTWAPAGAAFYDGELLAPWRGNLFFGALRGQHLHRLVLGGPGRDRLVAEERLFVETFGRIRDVAVGPDGALYFTTSNRDGRGRPAPDDDRVLRIVPGGTARR